MKSIDELDLPEDCRFDQDHTWVKVECERIRIGITDYAQDLLEKVIYVELPNVGDVFKKGEVFGLVESVKSTSELFMPIGGEIKSVNSAVRDLPELLNQSPYGEGWMIEVRSTSPDEIESLLTKHSYLDLLKRMD